MVDLILKSNDSDDKKSRNTVYFSVKQAKICDQILDVQASYLPGSRIDQKKTSNEKLV